MSNNAARPPASESDDKWLLLCDLVHDVAAEIAANVNNSGEQIEWLLSQGFTEQDIQAWLDQCIAS